MAREQQPVGGQHIGEQQSITGSELQEQLTLTMFLVRPPANPLDLLDRKIGSGAQIREPHVVCIPLRSSQLKEVIDKLTVSGLISDEVTLPIDDIVREENSRYTGRLKILDVKYGAAVQQTDAPTLVISSGEQGEVISLPLNPTSKMKPYTANLERWLTDRRIPFDQSGAAVSANASEGSQVKREVSQDEKDLTTPFHLLSEHVNPIDRRRFFDEPLLVDTELHDADRQYDPNNSDETLIASCTAYIGEYGSEHVMNMTSLIINDPEKIDPGVAIAFLHPIKGKYTSSSYLTNSESSQIQEVRSPYIPYTHPDELLNHPVTQFFNHPDVVAYLGTSGFSVSTTEPSWENGQSVFRIKAIRTNYQNVSSV